MIELPGQQCKEPYIGLPISMHYRHGDSLTQLRTADGNYGAMAM